METTHIMGEIFTVHLSETVLISEHIKKSRRREKQDSNCVTSSSIFSQLQHTEQPLSHQPPEELWKSELTSLWICLHQNLTNRLVDISQRRTNTECEGG
jgi:hypothetical protein